MKKLITYLKKIFSSPHPIEGRRIKITWLPKNNAAPSPNCYIGSEGIVEDLYEDGSFVLNMGGSLLIVGKKYKFVYL